MAANNKMKGLLRGLRYISNIFEAEEKEAEMQIGFPTDVKHVAHIGWDNNSPTSSEPTSGTSTLDRKGSALAPKSFSQDDHILNGEARNSSSPKNVPKPSKRVPSSSSSSTTTNPSSPKARHSRRHHHSSSTNSADREKSEGSRRGRRERATTVGSDTVQNTSSSLHDQEEEEAASSSSVPKQVRRRKAKSSSSSKSSSKSKEVGVGNGEQGHEGMPRLKPMKEDEEEEG